MRLGLKGAVSLVAILAAGFLLIGCGGGGGTMGGSGQVSDVAPRGTNWVPSLSKRRSVVWAVGDAADGSPTAQAVASMVTSRKIDWLLYLGDVYESGRSLEFRQHYQPLYGGLGSITAPAIGNHEWPNI